MPELKAIPSSLPEPPYPADTKANGWKPEFDIRRIKASRTWKLAGEACRSPLLRLWFEAWENIPVGSWPDDDELIAVSIDVTPEWFAGHKKRLMSGWQLHKDGNYYHPYITDMVLSMLERRKKAASKKKTQREKQKMSPGDNGDVPGDNGDVPRESRGCPRQEQEQEQEQEKNTPVSDRVLDVDISPITGREVGRNKSESSHVDEQPDAKSTTKGQTSQQAAPSPRKRRSQLNLETLPDDWRQWASEARPDLDLDRTWSLFVDHWLGNGEVKANWMATWRNWVRREQAPRRNGQQRPLTAWQEQQDRGREDIRQITAKIRSEEQGEQVEIFGERLS